MRAVTDQGTKYCGTENGDYELYLAVEDIDHARTKVESSPDLLRDPCQMRCLTYTWIFPFHDVLG
jgi:hypothetical protein